MTYDSQMTFEGLFTRLIEEEIIKVIYGYIEWTQLSPNDRPQVTEYIQDIAVYLYRALRNSGLEFDALVSVPTGGNMYADELIQLLYHDRHRDVERLRFWKILDQLFVLDCCPRKRVLVVEDCIHTGRMCLRAKKALSRAGHQVVGFLCVADLPATDSPARSKLGQVPIVSIFNQVTLSALRTR